MKLVSVRTPQEVADELEVQRLTQRVADAGIKQLQADVYYRSIMLGHGEARRHREWQEKHCAGRHQHFYNLRMGVGVFYYECACGDGTGQILWPERQSAI